MERFAESRWLTPHLEELAGLQQPVLSTALETTNNALALEILTARGWPAELRADRIGLPYLLPVDVARVNAHLVCAGIGVHAVCPGKRDLEAIFLGLIRSKAP